MSENLKPWKVISTKQLLDCPPWFKVFSDDWLLPSGEVVKDFLRIEARDYVLIFAIDDDRQVLLLKGYRPGCRDIVLQLPAGYVDDNDASVLDSAKRELLEETGVIAETWHLLGSFVGDGNWKLGTFHCYLAQGLSPVDSELPESDDPGKQILIWMSLEDVKAAWRAGQFGQAATVAAVSLAVDWLETSSHTIDE